MFEKKSEDAFVPNRASFKKAVTQVPSEPKPVAQPTPAPSSVIEQPAASSVSNLKSVFEQKKAPAPGPPAKGKPTYYSKSSWTSGLLGHPSVVD